MQMGTPASAHLKCLNELAGSALPQITSRRLGSHRVVEAARREGNMSSRGKDAPMAKAKPLVSTPTTSAAEFSTATASSKSSRSTERIKASTVASPSATTSSAATGVNAGGSSNSLIDASTTAGTDPSSTASSSSTVSKGVNGETDGPPVLSKQVSTTSTSSSNENTPSAQVNSSECAFCGTEGSGSPDEMMTCIGCGVGFHARCANLPQTPEEGDTFCRWECFSSFRKARSVATTPLGDFSKLAERVQSLLGDMPRRGSSHSQVQPSLIHQGVPSHDIDSQVRTRERNKRANGRSRSPSPYEMHDNPAYSGGRGNAYNGDRRLAGEVSHRRPSPEGAPAGQPGAFGAHIDLTLDDVEPPAPLSPRARPLRTNARAVRDDLAVEDVNEFRSKRPKYHPPNDPPSAGNGTRGAAPRRDSYTPPARRMHSPAGNGVSVYSNDAPQFVGSGESRRVYAEGTERFEYRNSSASGRGPPMQPMVTGGSRLSSIDGDHSSRPTSARSGRSAARYNDYPDEYDSRGVPRGGNAQVPPRSRPPSVEHLVDGSNSRRGRHSADSSQPIRHAQTAVPPTKYNIPWLNPAAFPAGLRERFNCRPDNVNGVFRIDLSPVFADKTMHLYQSEIDFFFRCFESADVSLVVKGMASELNQYIWAWPFILESCGSETHFSFDHFQFRHKAGEMPELEYVGELRLSMAAYNAYLERYLSGSVGNGVVVLDDHATKKPITLVAAENIIALNDLVIAEHCAQLYNDLIKSFQWDIFAGGIHCLLQYLPQANRHKRFASPLLHFNFPGARGRLRDPGNGTTDTAYQVLVGSLELVIFERLEPKDRDTFHRVLRAAGYDSSKKAMLLDSHLRVLRDAGFAWSTVLLSDGEFVHVNKGRLHFWRVVEPEIVRGPVINAPCVFLSWEWVYQGVSQRGISTECWFAMKNASLCTGGWAFDPRRAIVEAAKCGVAIVRTGQFLNSLSGPSAPPVLMQLAFTGPSPASIDREVVAQRQEQMVLFLESILPCMDAIVEEEFELGLVKDDSDDFRKVFDDEIMWKVVDTALSSRQPLRTEYECGICGLELTNIYKQCLGCTVHARRSRPNVAYPVFRICLRCHAQPEHHHFKPRTLHGYYDKLCSSEGHTGLLPATRRYQAERSYFKCRCTPYVRCADCGGCESCCCLCHTLFQTRFRYTAPEHLDHLRTDVVDVIKWHKQQQLQRQQQR